MRNKQKVAVLGIIVVFLVVAAVTVAAEQNLDLELTADELLIDDAESEVTATGNVKFSRGNIKLNADELIAKQEANTIEADGNVVINQRNRTLTAQHLKVDTQTEVGTLTGDPQYKADKFTITGKKFNFNLKTGELDVEQQVYLENKEEDVTAEAEHLSYYREQEEAVLTGNVIAHKGDRRMTAQKMTIDLETNKIKAEGKTTLTVPNADDQEQGDNNGN